MPKHKARVQLITFPPSEACLSRMNAEQIALYAREIRSFTENFKNVDYVDYSSDLDFTRSDFYDSDHLNDLGAKKLTKN